MVKILVSKSIVHILTTLETCDVSIVWLIENKLIPFHDKSFDFNCVGWKTKNKSKFQQQENELYL